LSTLPNTLFEAQMAHSQVHYANIKYKLASLQNLNHLLEKLEPALRQQTDIPYTIWVGRMQSLFFWMLEHRL
jgi:hypothetical protein